MISETGTAIRTLSSKAQSLTVDKWMGFLQRKCPDTFRHSERVALLAGNAAASFGLDSRDTTALIRGCFLHDVGKTMIPGEVLRNRKPLNPMRLNLMRLHPQLGAELLENLSIQDPEVIAVVRYHHERWDGKGYPEGLSGEEIPYLARICAVIEAYDSMISKRPYRHDGGRGEVRAC
ncbi:HD domain-containing protein [Paenibacillus sp. sptzw28]|uniref:HD-GYP domain-containing protein n=1 Tax=Paenibacillus sp. sptzw28 TaxID=715179 RepID=UPI001C6F3628|nr:HD domain-containing phosphohydrolase [Paenibacillus sp. sptzw28]QYR21493.1 HD domain-containing protein [Paenibacillus sp. sptzw28]